MRISDWSSDVCSQAVRHRFLVPAFAGSIPAAPASNCNETVGDRADALPCSITYSDKAPSLAAARMPNVCRLPLRAWSEGGPVHVGAHRDRTFHCAGDTGIQKGV